MADQIQGSEGMGPLSPQEKREYELEYKHGADLFKRALDDYSKSDNIFQKAEFKDVMQQAMQVLNDTAAELKRQELLKQNQAIQKDFAAFQDKDDDASISKLSKDLDKAKKSIG
ncbi:MAG: hypothetical protein JSS32_02375 [Verrucomicrobia bacterium]|nr:hypothetical protein [Verrucomicrobiota bacterium]